MSLGRVIESRLSLDWTLSRSGGNSLECLSHSHEEDRRNEVSLTWQLVKQQQLLILVRKAGYLGILVI